MSLLGPACCQPGPFREAIVGLKKFRQEVAIGMKPQQMLDSRITGSLGSNSFPTIEKVESNVSLGDLSSKERALSRCRRNAIRLGTSSSSSFSSNSSLTLCATPCVDNGVACQGNQRLRKRSVGVPLHISLKLNFSSSRLARPAFIMASYSVIYEKNHL